MPNPTISNIKGMRIDSHTFKTTELIVRFRVFRRESGRLFLLKNIGAMRSSYTDEATILYFEFFVIHLVVVCSVG